MSILSKLANINKATPQDASSKREMTAIEMEQCKTALRRDNRGYAVQPNKFDFHHPYRVAINYENKWHNYGNFSNADTAAAIGTIISVAFFGEKAKAGEYDAAIAEADPEFIAWLADSRNADVISKANGDSACVHGGGVLVEPAAGGKEESNPF